MGWGGGGGVGAPEPQEPPPPVAARVLCIIASRAQLTEIGNKIPISSLYFLNCEFSRNNSLSVFRLTYL